MNSKECISIIISGFVATVYAVLFAVPVHAINLSVQSGVDSARGNGQVANLFGTTGVFQTITNTLLFMIGSISVIMLVIGGLRYVVSGGESSAVTAAKNTILYAIVGVIVALLAYAAIAFVIGSFSAGASV